MIGGPLVTKRVRSGVTGEVLSPRGSTQGLDQIASAAPPAFGGALMSAVGGVAPHASALALPDMGDMRVDVPSINIPPATPHRKFFTHDGTGTGNMIVGIIGDALAGAAGQPGMYAAGMRKRQDAADEEALYNTRYAMKRQDDLNDRAAEASKAQYFSGNEDRVMYDPTTGTTRTLYDAPTPAQNYAATLGYGQELAASAHAIFGAHEIAVGRLP